MLQEANKASLVDLELKDCQKALEKIEIELSESETKLQQKIDETEALEKQIVEKDQELGKTLLKLYLINMGNYKCMFFERM